MYPFVDEQQDQEDSFPNYLRRRNIFDTPPSREDWFQGSLFSPTQFPIPGNNTTSNIDNTSNPSTRPSSAINISRNDNDFASLYKSISEAPEGPAQSQYRQYLQGNLPQKSQYKLG